MGVASSVFEAFLPKKAIRIRSSAYPRPTKRLTLTFTKQALTLEERPSRRVICCAGPYFALERWTLAQPYVEPAHPERFVTLSSVGDAAVRVEYEGGEERLERAESCILPASMGEARVVPDGGEASLVVCYVPDLEQDVVAPLRKAGHSDEEVRALGEIPA